MQFRPGHWALSLQKLPLVRFHSCAWLCRANAHGLFSAVGAGALTRPSRAVFHSWAGRPVSGPYDKERMASGYM